MNEYDVQAVSTCLSNCFEPLEHIKQYIYKAKQGGVKGYVCSEHVNCLLFNSNQIHMNKLYLNCRISIFKVSLKFATESIFNFHVVYFTEQIFSGGSRGCSEGSQGQPRPPFLNVLCK